MKKSINNRIGIQSHYFRLLLPVFAGLLSITCNKTLVDDYSHEMKIDSLPSNAVGIKDVEHYLALSQSINTKGGEVISIEPVVDKSQDTLLYIVNYAEGWVILSSDMRTPVEIAAGESGSISLDKADRTFLSWLNSVAIDLKRVRASSDRELSFSKQEMQLNINKWQNGNYKYVDSTELHKGHPLGEWVYAFSEVYPELLRQVPHMLIEHWAQGYPYNQYCPLDGNGNHYDVGCGGVAAGAMLHHQYRKNNYPTVFHGIPMDSLSVSYYSYSSNPDSLNATARYLRAINDEMGLTVLINYWQGGTFVLPGSVSGLFSNYGYNCSYSSYDSDILVSELLDNSPVIVLAFDEWILNLPDVTEGHYLIVDGYNLRRWVTAHHYVFQAGDQPVPVMDDIIVYEYGPTFVQWVKMNWGWGDIQTDSSWFALTGSWSTINGTYDTSRHMLYGF